MFLARMGGFVHFLQSVRWQAEETHESEEDSDSKQEELREEKPGPTPRADDFSWLKFGHSTENTVDCPNL